MNDSEKVGLKSTCLEILTWYFDIPWFIKQDVFAFQISVTIREKGVYFNFWSGAWYAKIMVY